MRTVPGCRIPVPIGYECIDFRLRQGVARLDGRPAGKAVQHLIDHQPTVSTSGREGRQPVDHLLNDRGRRCSAHQGGLRLNHHRTTTECLHPNTGLSQGLGMLLNQFKGGRGEVDSFRDQQRLHLKAPAGQPLAKLFIEQPLVEGMLIDDFNAGGILNNQIAVVQLKCPLAGWSGLLTTGRQRQLFRLAGFIPLPGR